MREMVITCDHCGKKLDTMIDYADTEFDTFNGYLETDLCSGCYKEISCIIEQFCKKEHQNEKEM